MNLLILGGTVFLGRHLTELALESGHTVTLFNRGQHNPDLFPEVEKLRGDRDGGLEALAGRRWDAVIDTCGYVPRIVRQSARMLAPAAERYAFVSSLSVYADFKIPGVDEGYPLAVLPDPTVETVDGETYGGLKALCERAVEEEVPGRTLIVRPGLIVGPHDPTDRFTYWPLRVARGGEVLVPGDPTEGPRRRAQIIDVRDLAAWMLRAVQGRRTGVYNATGPTEPLTWGGLLEDCRRVSGSDAYFTWVDEAFLLAEKVVPWSEIPLWIPDDPESTGFDAVSVARAVQAGLSFRPTAETVRDTLRWDATRPADRTLRSGLPPERESELLRKWRGR